MPIKKYLLYPVQEQLSKHDKFHNCTYFQTFLFYQFYNKA